MLFRFHQPVINTAPGDDQPGSTSLQLPAGNETSSGADVSNGTLWAVRIRCQQWWQSSERVCQDARLLRQRPEWTSFPQGITLLSSVLLVYTCTSL